MIIMAMLKRAKLSIDAYIVPDSMFEYELSYLVNINFKYSPRHHVRLFDSQYSSCCPWIYRPWNSL